MAAKDKKIVYVLNMAKLRRGEVAKRELLSWVGQIDVF